MPASHARLRALAVGIAAFALVSIAAGGTLAASTNPPTLYACFNSYGQVAMSTVPQCKLAGGGQLAYWSTVPAPGPTGPIGPTGATGATGAQGPAGTGATTHLLVFSGTTSIPVYSGAAFSVALTCDKAQALMGRSIQVTQPSANVVFTEQRENAVSITTDTYYGQIGSNNSAWTLTTVEPGDELWIAGGAEAFHVRFTATEYAPDGSCQLFATY